MLKLGSNCYPRPDSFSKRTSYYKVEFKAPWYKNFRGTITQLDDMRYVCSGEVAIVSDDTIEITELPIGVWTQKYKESTLEPMLEGGAPERETKKKGKKKDDEEEGEKEKKKKVESLITDFKEYHTDATVKFVVKMTPEKLRNAEREGLHKVFKLQKVLNLSSMVLFDAAGVLKKFNSTIDIMKDFFGTRKTLYVDRKRFLEGMLQAQSDRLSAQVRHLGPIFRI